MSWRVGMIVPQLLGSWQVDRQLTGAYEARMEGKATFTARTDGGADYFEDLQIYKPNGELIGGGEWRHVYRDTPEGLDIFKEDGGLYHRLNLVADGLAAAGRATHPCGDDHYHGVYEFLADGSFAIDLQVDGPRKGYKSRTIFTRIVPS